MAKSDKAYDERRFTPEGVHPIRFPWWWRPTRLIVFFLGFRLMYAGIKVQSLLMLFSGALVAIFGGFWYLFRPREQRVENAEH